MAERRLVFPSSLDGILKGLGPLATPALKAQIKANGLDPDHLPPAVPVEQWSPFLPLIATLAWPNEPRDEALRLLGLHFIRGWKSTAMGAAASALLKLVGPARTLTRLDRAFRTADNFSHAVTELMSPTEALVSINEVQGCPTYWVGILQGGLEVLGRVGTVEIADPTPPGAKLRIRWT